jgi:hypothetical protein
VWSAKLDAPALRAATGSADFSAKLWDALSGDQLLDFNCSHIVKSVDFSPCNRQLLCAGKFKKLKIFDLEKVRENQGATPRTRQSNREHLVPFSLARFACGMRGEGGGREPGSAPFLSQHADNRAGVSAGGARRSHGGSQGSSLVTQRVDALQRGGRQGPADLGRQVGIAGKGLLASPFTVSFFTTIVLTHPFICSASVCVCVCVCGLLQVKAIEVKKEITSVQLNCGGEVITFTAGTEVHFLDTTVSIGFSGFMFTPTTRR